MCSLLAISSFGVLTQAGSLTAVGSTTGISPETASTFSSGGFRQVTSSLPQLILLTKTFVRSNYWGIPQYQASAVSSYLSALGSTNQGLFNSSGRGFPDVAAQGEHVAIYSGGSQQAVAGTSCSSPIFASVIGLINDKLAAAGKPPLGFLNPWCVTAIELHPPSLSL